MANDPLAKHYATLTPSERFALMIEAMARLDEAEADRLEDTCPRLTYRTQDAEFRDRMRRAHVIALSVCLQMRAGLAQLRMADAFRLSSASFALGPSKVAVAAFLRGREHGRQEAGLVATEPPVDVTSLETLVLADEALGQEILEVLNVAREGVGQVAEEVLRATSELHAKDLRAQWEGFGEFCRERLGLEAPRVMEAFGLDPRDPLGEIAPGSPGAVADQGAVARWGAFWAARWDRRFW